MNSAGEEDQADEHGRARTRQIDVRKAGRCSGKENKMKDNKH